MAKQTINIGSTPNDGNGDTARAAFDICNDNFNEVYNEVFFTQEKGVVGDNATDDTTAFQQAITDSYDNVLKVPSGTFIISQLNITGNIIIEGDGEGTILKQKNATNGNFISINGDGLNVLFRNLVIDQNNANQGATTGLFSVICNRSGTDHNFLRCENVVFRDFCEGAIAFYGDISTSTKENLYVDNCRFVGGLESTASYDTYHIYASGGGSVLVQNSFFDFNATPSTGGCAGIFVSNTQTATVANTKLTVKDCEFYNLGRFSTGNGVGVIDFYTWAEEAFISGNKIYNSFSGAIRGKTNSPNVIITNNFIDGFGRVSTECRGISVNPLASATTIQDNLIISENIVLNAGGRGINVEGASESIISCLNISGNIVRDCADAACYLRYAEDIQIQGNIFKDIFTGIVFSDCSGLAKISNNEIYNSDNECVSEQGTSTTLQLTIIGNTFKEPTNQAVDINGIDSVLIASNQIIDVVSGAVQRGIRIQNITNAAVIGNQAIGTFASGELVTATIGTLKEFVNSWQ